MQPVSLVIDTVWRVREDVRKNDILPVLRWREAFFVDRNH